MKRFCLFMLAALAFLVPRAGEAAQPDYPFQTYEVPLYQGPVKYPDFQRRDRAFADYRTRIRDGVKQGVNFAGRYSLIQFGCGTGCSMGYVTDVSSGKVQAFPRGGDDNLYMRLQFTPKSSLVVVRWYGADTNGPQKDRERCFEEMLVWRGGRFDRIGIRDVGDEAECWKE